MGGFSEKQYYNTEGRRGLFIAENDWKSREIVKLLRNHWKVSSVDSWHCSLLISPGCYSLIGFPMRLSLFWEYRKKSIHKESLIDSWSWPRIAFSMNRRTLRLIQCSFIYLFKINEFQNSRILVVCLKRSICGMCYMLKFSPSYPSYL